MKILYLIIAKNGDLWENDKASQQQTWAKEANERIIRYLYCTKDIKCNSSNSMIVDCEDEYEFILKKTILGVHKAVNEINFDFMVRSNVSTYFDTTKVLNKLVYLSQESPVALGYFEQHKKTYRFQLPNKLFISGSAIILNHSAAKVLSGMDWHLYNSIPDDVAISHFLWTNKVALMHLSRNNYHITHFPASASIHRLKSSEFSHLTSERMKLLDDFNNANKIQARVFLFLYMIKMELVNSMQKSTLFRDFAVRPSLHLQSRIRCRMALIQAKIDCV